MDEFLKFKLKEIPLQDDVHSWREDAMNISYFEIQGRPEGDKTQDQGG